MQKHVRQQEKGWSYYRINLAIADCVQFGVVAHEHEQQGPNGGLEAKAVDLQQDMEQASTRILTQQKTFGIYWIYLGQVVQNSTEQMNTFANCKQLANGQFEQGYVRNDIDRARQ